MQNRLFALGFGPLPYFRRPGVVLLISPDESEDDDPECYRLGCVVPHCNPRCCRSKENRKKEGRDACYLCQQFPFVEVLFHNARSAYDDEEEEEEADGRNGWTTVPVTPR